MLKTVPAGYIFRARIVVNERVVTHVQNIDYRLPDDISQFILAIEVPFTST